ncbi:MAG: NADH-quinone oxidoreductase subunit J [Anaerolineales bacterium]|nr:MAG: NADH-quinone oxidoreductase subunit J [Chloroflexota bacterium]MBE7434183.1 NADH-quinone oxidoreductase subunit J [Anaerolineales bacterium]MCE7859373.1 NADH-quinone oxidoreductase subunit J [Chloroflexi bacterium CFX2]MCK6582568.1 NADH-quinone oxidoreductase subunit J [Anaerolineales bacterium]GJQ34559.1 MAG: NADH-quinone oxidoreductase subunit J [Anaerolineaceae bacterium]
MSSDLIVFLVLSLVAIVTAIVMLLHRNPVYSALFLVLNFIAVAVFYLLLGAPFIAMAQITVYAGAIMVLFLFVIMLLGAERLPDAKVLRLQRPLAYGLAAVLAAETIYLLLTQAGSDLVVTTPDASLNTMESLREIAMELFNRFLLPFEVTSILLLVAMIGAIVLSKREKGEPK